MKKFFFGLFIIYTSLFGQQNSDLPPLHSRLPFESEIISLPRTDDYFSVYYTFRVPYKLLVFERKSESFEAEFRVIVEIMDENSVLVARDINDSRITVSTFEETNDNSLYLQNFLEFKIKAGEYEVAAIISDRNSSGELPIKPKKITLEKNKSVQHPLVIIAQDFLCEEKKAFILANAGGKVPFSGDKYNLIIPLADTSVTELNIIVENEDETIISTKVDESYIIPIGVVDCDKHISVTSSSENVSLRHFVVRNVNEKLKEGDVILKVSNDDNSFEEEFHSEVVWFNKPFSLMDPEKAIEYLNFVESDSIVYSMLKESSSDYPELLNNYWLKYDPTPETVYNEIMFEYYNRVDYAIKEFRGISKDNGAKTDRGVVYIKFGKPDKIERTSNPQGQMIEIWNYSDQERKFLFIDRKGTGNFTLTEN